MNLRCFSLHRLQHDTERTFMLPFYLYSPIRWDVWIERWNESTTHNKKMKKTKMVRVNALRYKRSITELIPPSPWQKSSIDWSIERASGRSNERNTSIQIYLKFKIVFFLFLVFCLFGFLFSPHNPYNISDLEKNWSGFVNNQMAS